MCRLNGVETESKLQFFPIIPTPAERENSGMMIDAHLYEKPPEPPRPALKNRTCTSRGAAL